MNPKRMIFGIAVALYGTYALSVEPPPEPNAVTIPLDQIWGYQMPGTRDVREMSGTKTEKSLYEILQSLGFRKAGSKTKRAFAVSGIDDVALNAAHAVLVEGKNPASVFPSDSDISIVFFSHLFGYYVHLQEVRYEPGTVTISYVFVPHRTKELTSHFAIIPVGKLQPGTINVEVVRTPMDKSLIAAGFKAPSTQDESCVVSQSFKFQVQRPKSKGNEQ